jgi:hypothetical protein
MPPVGCGAFGAGLDVVTAGLDVVAADEGAGLARAVVDGELVRTGAGVVV